MKTGVLLPVVLALASLGSAALCQEEPKARPALPAPPVITVRYVCFTATPKAGAAVEPEERVRQSRWLIQTAVKGLDESVYTDPKALLARLERLDPGYAFRLHFAGHAVPGPDGSCAIEQSSAETDPVRFAVYENLTLEGTRYAAVHGGQREMSCLSRIKKGGRAIACWGRGRQSNPLIVPTTLYGTGKTHVLGDLDSGADGITIYAVCFLESGPARGDGQAAPR